MKENRAIYVGLSLVALVLIVTYYLYHLERQHQEDLTAAEQRVLDLEASALEAQSSGELEVVLYFRRPGVMDPGDSLLVSETRSIFETDDTILTARQIINELISGSTVDGLQIFPPEARLRQVYVLEGGTAVVDFSEEAVRQLGGVVAELAALHAVSRSLIENVEDINQVKFLVEGQERPTFAGHISISQPFM